MLPSIVAQVVVLLKDSLLGFSIAYAELLRAVQQIGAQYFNLLPTFIVGATVYVALNLTVTGLAKALERRTSRTRRGRTVTAAEKTAATSSTGG